MVKLLLGIQKTACLNRDQINGYITGYFVIACYRYAAKTDYFVISATGTQQGLIISWFLLAVRSIDWLFCDILLPVRSKDLLFCDLN